MTVGCAYGDVRPIGCSDRKGNTMVKPEITIECESGDSITFMHSVVVTHAYVLVQDRTKACDPQLADISRDDAIKIRDWLNVFIKYSE